VKKKKRIIESDSEEDPVPEKKKAPAKTPNKIEKNDEDLEAILSVDSENKSWQHESFDFLKPENIRDINKNKRNHPDYDCRTLHVPEAFLVTQTPGHA
jgi:hypothetical protein